MPLCEYQQKWIDDHSRFKIAVKARRIGFTFAATLEIALDVVSRKTRWLIVSRTQDTAKEALKEVRNHLVVLRLLNKNSERFSERPTDLFFDGMRISQFVISLPNGSEVIAMTSHPDAARGFGGNVFLDEHGFHPNSEELWKGVAASVLRGHRLVVVSTPHYQAGNFYRLAREADLVSGRPPLRETLRQSEPRASASGPPQPDVKPLAGGRGSDVASLWSAHWVDIHTAIPQLREINVPIDLNELRELAGDEETWNQEFCCQFLSAASMWIPLEMIAAARSQQANLDWDPNRTYQGSLYVGADIGRKRDRTAIWIDERIADVAICRGLITLDRTSFERQFELLAELIAHPSVRRASIDQTGIGMALVERLQEKLGPKVEGITFTAPLKEDLSLRIRRRMEERLDKIPDNAPEIERDLAAVRREITATGNLRFDAERTDAGHSDIYWAKALADYAADTRIPTAVSLGADPELPIRGERFQESERRVPYLDPNRQSIWDASREGIFG